MTYDAYDEINNKINNVSLDLKNKRDIFDYLKFIFSYNMKLFSNI